VPKAVKVPHLPNDTAYLLKIDKNTTVEKTFYYRLFQKHDAKCNYQRNNYGRVWNAVCRLMAAFKVHDQLITHGNRGS
jgi:hypothetical protein